MIIEIITRSLCCTIVLRGIGYFPDLSSLFYVTILGNRLEERKEGRKSCLVV